MAGALRFAGLADFTTGKPDVLRQELQREHRDVAATFARAERLFEPVPTVRKLVASGPVTFFELVVVDTTSGDVRIELPRITSQDEGKWVEVLKKVAANTASVRPDGVQLIQGSTLANLTTPIGVWRFRVADGAWWTRV